MSRHLYANRYQASDVIGSGRTSEVHRGQDKLVGRDVVIKVLRADLVAGSVVPGPVPPGGEERGGAQPPGHPRGLRQRRAGDRRRTGALHRDGVRRRADAAGGARRRGDGAAAAGPADRGGDLRRSGLLPPARHGAPGHQAGQRDARPERLGQGDGLRYRAGDRRRSRQTPPRPPSSVRRSTSRPSRPAARPVMPGPTSTRPAACCTRCSPAHHLSPVDRRSPWRPGTSVRHRGRRARSSRALPKELDAIVLKALSKNPANRYQTRQGDAHRPGQGTGRSIGAGHSGDDRGRAGRPDRGGAARRGGRGDRRVEAAAREGGIPHGPVLLAPVVTLSPPTAGDGIDPDAAARNRRRWRMVALGAVGIAVVVALWLTLMVILAPPPPAAVAVPDLTGMTLEQAVGKLSDKQLTLGTVTQGRHPGRRARHRGQPAAVLADPGRPEHPGERGDRAALGTPPAGRSARQPLTARGKRPPRAPRWPIASAARAPARTSARPASPPPRTC